MKTLALTAALGAAVLFGGCNQKASTASPGAIDTPACCASKDKAGCDKAKADCGKAKAGCDKAKAAGCPKAAAAAKAAGTSPCCASKKK